MHGIESLLSNLNNHLGSRWLFSIFSFRKTFTSMWHWQRKRFISPEPKIRSPTFPISSTSSCLAIILSNLFTGKQRLFCCGSGISPCPLLHLGWEPHALSCVCATANVCLRAKECKPPLLISPLRRSHRAAEEWEAGKKKRKQRIMMREKHSSGSPVHPHCSAQHSSSALLSCLSSEPHANA